MTKHKLRWMIAKQRLGQKLFGKSLPVQRSWQETPQQFDDLTDFLNWFDSTKSIADTVRKAALDWQFRFASFDYFKELNRQRALEIGFGGGRLLCMAAKDFELVYGVDIHESFDMTEKFLGLQDCRNYRLVHRDELATIPDESIDFVYSFIVFQHFDSMEEVDFYLAHIERLLTDDGIAHIYFGKNKEEGIIETPSDEFHLRDCSLFVAPPLMREYVSRRFKIVDFRDSLPRDPETKTGESAQAMVIFRKSAVKA